MNFLRLLKVLLMWHFRRGIIELLTVERKAFKEVLSTFSVSLLLKTFFQPWKRMSEGYQKGNPSSWLGTFIINTLMRLVGVVVRSLFLIVSFTIILIVALVALVAIIGWLLLPVIIIILLVVGFNELIQ